MPKYEVTDSLGNVHAKECATPLSHCVVARMPGIDPVANWCGSLKNAKHVIASIAKAGGNTEVHGVVALPEPELQQAPQDDSAGAI
jgi:hypothetical protein